MLVPKRKIGKCAVFDRFNDLFSAQSNGELMKSEISQLRTSANITDSEGGLMTIMSF